MPKNWAKNDYSALICLLLRSHPPGWFFYVQGVS
jgi:hypothetical protein